MATLDWQAFEPDTLLRAEREGRPILLLLETSWCTHCKALHRTTLEDARVIAGVARGWVPVRVDAERRPDVNSRFGTGRWPTLAFLTPRGELLATTNALTAAELADRLAHLAADYAANRESIDAGIENLWRTQDTLQARAEQRIQPGLSATILDEVRASILERFDYEHGGFGTGAKFPHSEALDYALIGWAKQDDAQLQQVVVRTLDAMVNSPMHDTVAGGFFRHSMTSDWQTPDFEKTLDTNAMLLRNLLEGYQILGKQTWRDAALGIGRWIEESMTDPDTGAFYGSQDADPDYYRLDAKTRSRRDAPARDRTVHANRNAMAISSLLKGAAVLDRRDWRDAATRALRFLVDQLYDSRVGVYHYWDGTYHLPGMLSDQACMIRALVDASQHTGDADLLLPAEAIAERALETQRADGGGFFDIPFDPRSRGTMRRRNRSILENSMMAEALIRLAYLSHRSEFLDEALAALQSFAASYREYGYYVAGYGRAIDLVYYEPLTITILGARESEPVDALRRTALTRYVPSRIVQTLDPETDPVLIERGGFSTDDLPAAHVCVGHTTKHVVQTAAALDEAIIQVEVERRAAGN